jgi:glycosyltransferase involved in cell wall biosynthesis
MIALITDAAPSANSSTSREVQDFTDICKANNCQIVLIYPSKDREDKYMGGSFSITCRPIFYKSNNLFLRLISEVYIALMISIKIMLIDRSKLRVSKVIFISPSIFNIFPSVIFKKMSRADLYLVLRDMFPFWMVDIGKIKEGSIAFLIFKKLADLQMKSSTFIGVESKNSLNFFLEKYPEYTNKTEILWNWISTKKKQDSEFINRKIIKVIYAGSIGEAQGVSNFIALVNHWKHRNDIEVHIFGRGVGLRSLQLFAKNQDVNNLFVHQQVAGKIFDECLKEYDVGLFFLRHDLRASNIPGKFMSYVMNGLPVLGSVNPENELISFVALNGLGYLDSSGVEKNFLDYADMIINDVKSKKFSSQIIQMRSLRYFSTQRAFEQIMKNK